MNAAMSQGGACFPAVSAESFSDGYIHAGLRSRELRRAYVASMSASRRQKSPTSMTGTA